MTISSTNTKNSYSGDGSTVAFSYTFKILDDDDIQVILRTNATGAETVQTKTTHYSVSGVGNAGGGTITFVSAPAATETVVLIRAIPLTQTTDYTPNDPFPAVTHEDALDKLTLMAQDTQEEVDRSIKLSRTNTMTSTEFTVGATDRANKVFAFDSSGELAVTQEIGTFQGDWAASTAYAERDLVKDTSTNNIFIVNSAHTSSGSQPLTTNTNSSKYDLIVDAAAATTSATNAATSATAAAASATAAAASESAAATSETNAAASEAGVAADAAAAAASASSASTSASNASTSETNASNSASAAATSATNAATSATSASNSASAASTSASNAATSESNASDSADAASTSASNAASSASSASTSETNAASSASAAASDASAAATSAAAAAASFDAFDDIYLGAKASAPTQDNDGDALTAGDQYFNTTNDTLFVWNGSAWQAASPDIVGDTTPQLGGDLDTNGNDILFGDNDKALFGTGSDLQIYHDNPAGYSVIADVGTGNLELLATDLAIRNADRSATYMSATNGGEVSIRHNGSPKFATTASGIDVTGTITFDGGTTSADLNFGDNAKAVFGTAADGLQIYNEPSGDKRIVEAGDGNLKIQGDNLYLQNSAGTENHIIALTNGAVTLHHDASPKFATTSSGIDVTGTVTADQLDTDNIRIDGNTISSTDTNGHISLSPNGTGGVVVGDTAPQGDDASLFGPVFTVDSGSYDGLIEIAGNRSDGDNAGVAKMQFIQKANSATYKEVAEIAVETDGATANKRGGSLLFKTRADNSTDTPTRMTIDSSGNVGIGVTPSAWGSAWVAAQVGVGSTIAGRTTDYTNTNIVSNAYFDGTNWKYLSSNTASKYYQLSGNHIWDTAASGTAGNNITFSEAARIDSSGDATFTGYVGAEGGNAPSGGFHLKDTGGTSRPRITNDASNATVIRAGSATGNVKFNNFANTTELVQITDSGNVGIGTGSPSFTSGNGLHLADNYFAGFGTGASGRPDFQIGTVGGSTLDFRCGTGADTVDLSISTGGVFTGDFNDTSDERLKENIQDIAANQIDVVKQLRPVTFDWRSSEKGSNTGFIAQEVMALLPNDVQRSDPDDENSTLGINSMALVATLTGALQEAIAKIEALEARIAALEGA